MTGVAFDSDLFNALNASFRFSAQEDEDETRPNLIRRTTIGNGSH